MTLRPFLNRVARFLPRSLRARLLLLVLATVLLAQAASMTAATHYRRTYLDAVAMDLMATTIRTLRASLATVPAAERADFVRRTSRGEWQLWSRDLPAGTHVQRRPPPPAHGRAPGHAGPKGPPPHAGASGAGAPGAGAPGAGAPGAGAPATGASTAGAVGSSSPGGATSGTSVARATASESGTTGAAGGDVTVRGESALLDPGTRRTLRDFTSRITEQLGDGTRVGISRGDPPVLFISLSSGPDTEDWPRLREWLVIPLDRIEPPVATPLIVSWLTGLALVLITAAGFSWHITRPMTQLAQAADRMAAGHPQRVVPAGPHETRVLGERFNAMLDALADADTVRRTLLAGLPHDLKGPLSRMWLRIEMTNDSVLREGLRTDVQDMQHIVDQFIGFVRGTDPAAYRYTAIDLSHWLAERVSTWQGAGSPVSWAPAIDGMAAATTQPPSLPEAVVNGDAVALARLIDNLVQNAMQHGAPPVHVALRIEADHAVISVADHGQGIPPERRTEALQPFSRLDEARSRSGNVGLGLALIDAITRAHGGRLVLLTSPAGGLLVEVWLPLQVDGALSV